MSDDAFNRLPEEIEDNVYEDGPDQGRLNINEWSLCELNVPSYPEIRIYKSVAREICAYALDGTGVKLVIQRKITLGNRTRPSVYACSGLAK